MPSASSASATCFERVLRVAIGVAVDRPFDRARDDLGVAVILGGVVDELLDQQWAILHQAEHRAFLRLMKLRRKLPETSPLARGGILAYRRSEGGGCVVDDA